MSRGVRRTGRLLCALILAASLLGWSAGIAGATEAPTARYALIVEGYTSNQTQLGWYWDATKGMLDYLRDDYGIPAANIYFLFQDMRGGDSRVDGLSTVANVTATLNTLASTMRADDQLYCYFVDHGNASGGHSYFHLQDGDLSDTWMDGKADAIAALHQTWVFTQCNSGGFASAMAEPGRIILTSTRITESNMAAFAEPVRDGFHFTTGTPPTVSAAYENAVDSVWADYSTGPYKTYAFDEHCLINDFGQGSGRYGKYLQAGNFVGPETPSGQSFEMSDFVVSASSQQVDNGTAVRVRFEYYNFSANPITFQTVCCGCRDPQGINRDFGHVNNVTLNPYDSLLFDAQITVDKLGNWQFWPAFQINGGWGPYRWHQITLDVPSWLAGRDALLRRLGDRFGYYAGPSYSSVDPQLQLTNFAVYGPVLGDTGFARPNDTVTVRFTFKNTGATSMTFSPYGILVGCRDPQGYNRDFGHHDETLAAGQSLTREATIVVDKPGAWIFWPAYYYNGHWGPYQWQAITLNVYERSWVDSIAGAAWYTVGYTANTAFGSGTVQAAAYGYAVTRLTSDGKYVFEGKSHVTGAHFTYKGDTLQDVRGLINGATATMEPGVRHWWLDIGLPGIGG